MTINSSIYQSSSNWTRIDANTFKRVKQKEGSIEENIYSISHLLGKGISGSVYVLAPNDGITKKKAIKVCSPLKDDPRSAVQKSVICPSLIPPKYFGLSKNKCLIEREYELLAKLPQSPGLIKPVKAFFPHDSKKELPACFIMKHYDFDFDSPQSASLSIDELASAITQLITGLKTLHENKITHRDLETDIFSLHPAGRNVLYDTIKKEAVLADFGRASKFVSAPLEVDYDIDPDWEKEIPPEELELLELTQPALERPLADADKTCIQEDIEGLRSILNVNYHNLRSKGCPPNSKIETVLNKMLLGKNPPEERLINCLSDCLG